ncbi:GNAT family N-acetyltransferase [Neisseriaceae bacterium JH1-16]|nr:GNAT family N-acetyltransferase [Neisseriaceae bacterium JH1-16]
MALHRADAADLATLSGWIADARECLRWGGPQLRFPLELPGLAEQLAMTDGNSFCLREAGRCLAFGQLLVRGPHRLHLARILVDPAARGRGLGRALVVELLAEAQRRRARIATLNVYRWNPVAQALYGSLGFEEADMPGDEAVRGDDVVFMSLELSGRC